MCSGILREMVCHVLGYNGDKSKYILSPESRSSTVTIGPATTCWACMQYIIPTALLFWEDACPGRKPTDKPDWQCIYTGDISAILMKNLPAPARRRRTPESIALIPDWEEKLRKLTDYAIANDIRAMVGVPSWMLILLKKIVEETGRSIPDIWPSWKYSFTEGWAFFRFRSSLKK